MLPLLSHALDQAWRSRAGQALTLADYERTGGIEGAVAVSAQRAYDRLTPAQQEAARQVFTRLTATTARRHGHRRPRHPRRADRGQGRRPGPRDVEAVLEAFAAERLLTLAAGTVEISHEALLTAWPLLRDTWLAETRADRVTRTRLQATAAEWERRSRDPAYLYRRHPAGGRREAAARIAPTPPASRRWARPRRLPARQRSRAAPSARRRRAAIQAWPFSPRPLSSSPWSPS